MAIRYVLMWFLFMFLAFNFSCKEGNEKKHKHKVKEDKAIANAAIILPNIAGIGEANCDTSLWKYVYNPDRLQVIEKCKTVTGVIEESNADEDGDQHMLLKLDDGQEDLLTKKNKKKKQGDLVIEAVCVNQVLLKKVGATCNGYINQIQLPRIGDHVSVTGSLVNDTHNGWNEIHPISKIEVIH